MHTVPYASAESQTDRWVAQNCTNSIFTNRCTLIYSSRPFDLEDPRVCVSWYSRGPWRQLSMSGRERVSVTDSSHGSPLVTPKPKQSQTSQSSRLNVKSVRVQLLLTLTHTSTTTHLSSTSNIFAKFGLMKVKICRHTTSRYYYRFVSFF